MRDFDQRFVAQDPVARDVALPGLALPPSRHLPQDREKPAVAVAALDPAKDLHGFRLVGGGIAQCRHFLVQPPAAARGVDPLLELEVDLAQMGDVAERIVDLPLAQGTQRPVGEPRSLVEARARQPGDQRFVAHLVAETADHARHLGIEHRHRQAAREEVKDLQVLPGGVENLDGLGHIQQPEQRIEVHAVREGIDGGRLVDVRDLHQAQLRPEGALAHELRVDGDEFGAGEAPTKRLEIFRGCNQCHGGRYTGKQETGKQECRAGRAPDVQRRRGGGPPLFGSARGERPRSEHDRQRHPLGYRPRDVDSRAQKH